MQKKRRRRNQEGEGARGEVRESINKIGETFHQGRKETKCRLSYFKKAGKKDEE